MLHRRATSKLYVRSSPELSGDRSGTAAARAPADPPFIASLAEARDAVRALLKSDYADRPDIEVRLLPGRHRIPATGLELGPDDGGQHPGQMVRWTSDNPHDPAVIDGGFVIPGPWVPSAEIKGALVAPLPAETPANVTLRQLWVGGRRASRPVVYAVDLDGRWPTGGAGSGGGCCPQPCRNRDPPFYPCATCNCSVVNTSTGYDFTNSEVDPSRWRNPSDVEFVFHFPGQWTPWIEPRCTVATITGRHVALKQPCFGDLTQRNLGPSKGQKRPLPPPAFIENVFENLTQPGQWYYDRDNALVFYIPRLGETTAMIGATAVSSVAEVLLAVNGTRNLEWAGVGFEHSTWTVPNSEQGYVDWQAGYSGGYGTFPDYADCATPELCSQYADANGCGSTTRPAAHCVVNRGLEPLGKFTLLGLSKVHVSSRGCGESCRLY